MSKRYIVKVEHLDATDPDRGVGELCIRFPDELVEQLGWEIGDEIEWGETEICEEWGEHQGFTLSNVTKNPKVKPNTWKYGLIKVALDGPSFDTVQINMLVELYPLGKTGKYDTFCRASLQTLEDIEMAKRDIERDGINEYFFNNGTFKWVSGKEAHDWDWTPKEDDET